MNFRRIKKLLTLKNILIGCGLGLVLFIGIDLQNDLRKQGKFRSMQDPISSIENVDLTGLRDLSFAGGAVLSFSELQKLTPPHKGQKIVVDGTGNKYRFINGIPDAYLEYSHQLPSWKAYLWRLVYTGTTKAHPEQTVSEKEAAKKHGYGFGRFSIGSKAPSYDSTIDHFIVFIENLPKDVWVYFHCKNGKGRTSMMLVMADIIKNAPVVALEDIIKRQFLLGSVDLFDTTLWFKGTYSIKILERRMAFIQDFYDFICQRKAGGIQRWSDWPFRREVK